MLANLLANPWENKQREIEDVVDETVNMIQRSTDKRETTFRRINVLSEKVTSLTESELTVNAVPVNNFLNTIENLLDELNELKIKSEDIFNYVVATKDMYLNVYMKAREINYHFEIL